MTHLFKIQQCEDHFSEEPEESSNKIDKLQKIHNPRNIKAIQTKKKEKVRLH